MWSRRSPSGCGDVIWQTVVGSNQNEEAASLAGLHTPSCNVPHLILHQEDKDHVPWPWKTKNGTSFIMRACLISQILLNLDARRPFCLCKVEALKLKITWEPVLSD